MRRSPRTWRARIKRWWFRATNGKERLSRLRECHQSRVSLRRKFAKHRQNLMQMEVATDVQLAIFVEKMEQLRQKEKFAMKLHCAGESFLLEP
jgi:hypothetical protein